MLSFPRRNAMYVIDRVMSKLFRDNYMLDGLDQISFETFREACIAENLPVPDYSTFIESLPFSKILIKRQLVVLHSHLTGHFNTENMTVSI